MVFYLECIRFISFFLFLFLTVFASFSRSYICLALILILNIVFAFNSKMELREYLKRILFPFPVFVIVIYLPLYVSLSITPLLVSIKFDIFIDSVALALRVATSISLILLYTLTTTFSEFSYSLRKMKAPKQIVMLIYFTFLYINLFIREALRILITRKSRWFGGSYRNYLKVFSSAVGLLFLSSLEKGEMLWLGLKSRSYNFDFVNINSRGYSTIKCVLLYIVYIGTLLFFAFLHSGCSFFGAV